MVLAVGSSLLDLGGMVYQEHHWSIDYVVEVKGCMIRDG